MLPNISTQIKAVINPQFRLAPSGAHPKQCLCSAHTFLHSNTLPLLGAGVGRGAPSILASGAVAGTGCLTPLPSAKKSQHGSKREEAVPKMKAATCPAQAGTASCMPCKGLPGSPSWTPHTGLNLEDIKQGKSTKATSLKPLLWVGHPSATTTGNAISPSLRCLSLTSPWASGALTELMVSW